MNKNTFLFKIGSILLLLVSALLIIFYRVLFPCNNQEWYIIIAIVLAFVLFPVSLYRLLKLFKVEYSRWFWTGIISLALYFYAFHKGNNQILDDIKVNGGVVKTAVVYKRYSSIQSSESISVTYKVGEKNINAKYNCSKDIYNRLVVGDTILVVFPLQCPDRNLPYNYFPTTKEIRQCKEGCLLKNGELLLFN